MWKPEEAKSLADPQIMNGLTRYDVDNHPVCFSETVEKKYTINLGKDKLLGFSSDGYMLSHYEDTSGVPNCMLTFNLTGETLGKFTLKDKSTLSKSQTDNIPFFQTSYWNEAQDQMTFMIPFCDTVFQMHDPQTVVPLYNLNLGRYGILTDYAEKQEVTDEKIWLRTLYENSKGLFMGLYQKKGPKLVSWLGFEYEYKPTLSYQAVYMKDEGKTYVLPRRGPGICQRPGRRTHFLAGRTNRRLSFI